MSRKNDTDLRLIALDRAISFFGTDPCSGDDVIGTASEFFKFIKGRRD